MSDMSHMTGPGEDDRVLMAEYVLGLLRATEHDRVAMRLRDDAGLRAEERLWKLRLQSLDREFVETAAPASVLARLESRLFGEANTAGGLAGWWNSLALWRGLATAGVAVAAIAVGFNVTAPRPDPQAFAAQLVAALHSEGSNVSFVALYNRQGELRITPLSGDQPGDKDYELWAIEGSGPAKSMGVIAANARNDVTVAPDILVDFGEGTTLAVTLEQKGGSPTGVAQGPIVAVGTATLI
ncbi:MAG: anti-sigma factor [Devosia sp.]